MKRELRKQVEIAIEALRNIDDDGPDEAVIEALKEVESEVSSMIRRRERERGGVKP